MSNRQRSLSAENPLLGMIVDRTSFDEDDPATGIGSRKSRSFDDDDSLSVDSSSSFGLKKTRSGKVRRKLRWKPPGFRSRKKKSSAASVMSSSDKSNKTNKSNMSFHTFHSTETPVIDNKKTSTPVPLSRPDYPDSFEGVVTIDSEGRYVHSRMNQQSKGNGVPRSQTMPPSRREKKWGGWDFNSVSVKDDSWESFDKESKVFDPYGDAIKSNSWKQKLPPRKRSRAPLPVPSTPSQSPPWTKHSLQTSPNGTPSTVASSASEISVSAFPALDSDEYEGDRRVDLFEMSSPRSIFSVADAAAGGDVFSSPNDKRRSPEVSASETPSAVKRKQRSLMGKLPMHSPRSGKKQVKQNRVSPEEDESFEAVPAKVNVSLDGPSNLKNIVAHSGLLNGKQYLPQRYLPDSLRTPAAHKSHNRPVDRCSSSASTSTDGFRAIRDDDSLSTKDSMRSGEILVEELQLPPTGEIFTERDGQQRKSRKSTGPVDIDDGSFLEAEKNLRAIHDMAAEHLAHGEHEEALDVFEEILRGQKERYGPDHYRVGTALHNIGIVYLKSGQFEKAVEVCEEAVDVRRKALGANHPDVAVSLAQLGVAHLEFCQYRKALLVFREALNIRREFLGPKHPKVGKLLNNVGCALFAVDELEGAKLAFEEALEIQRETLRGDSSAHTNQILLSVASTLCNLGSIKVRWGLYEEASVSLEEALLIQQSVLGDDHPTVLNTIKSIDFVDKAINDGDAMFGTYKDLYTCQNPTEFLLPDPEGLNEVSLDCAAQPPAMDQIVKDMNEVSLDCTSTPSTISKVMNVNIMQLLGLDKTKRWYQKIEQRVIATEAAACGPLDVEVKPSQKRSKTSAEI